MSLKQEIENRLGISVRVRAGAPGSLRVIVNGETVYSKQSNGRLDSSALIETIRNKSAAV